MLPFTQAVEIITSVCNIRGMHMSTIKLVTSIPALALLATTIAQAQTTTPTTTPGAPSTGVGGDAVSTTLVLIISALVVAAGMTYLGRKFDVSQK